MNTSDIEKLITIAMPDADVVVESDDGVHFSTRVIAAEFEGKMPIARHRLIYASLGDGMKEKIHALSIQAYTPSEWSKKS